MTSKSDRRGRGHRRGRPSEHAPSLSSVFFSAAPHGRSRGPRGSANNKSRQLCRQVQRRLDLALCELDDPLLQGLWVQSVEQEPGGRALVVEVVTSDPAAVAPTLARLDAARGWLRSEVAAAIHRKRTPYLQFVVVTQDVMPRELDAPFEPEGPFGPEEEDEP
ncbi:ribosome-binding factor A [Paraliomyxa miuraensis]|uniref:ribosome-binding factor A n=1 Tax=Paraliomyxa miuraensis TaxID=376150 RepID=UPI00225B29AA|nr:ribosome-binding factor A [Paraliomyxa miuraensis]MCX4247827.1 ribosome-binding factor A [Paraliomyxa miuraensis]